MAALNFRRLLPAGVLCITAGIASAQGVTTPRTPSPGATVSQTIGISTVTINYSRPSVKGRKIWGDLVPYGWVSGQTTTGQPMPWRAGANENTVIKFSHPVTVEGHSLPAGEYGLFFVPGADNTALLILSRDTHSWGAFFYDSAADVLRATIHTRDIAPVETLTYSFDNLTKNSGEAVLTWEKKALPIKIEFDVDDIVINNSINELKGPTGFNAMGYASAAQYALENNTHLDKALQWATTAANIDPSFPNLALKSMALAKNGKTAEADKIMKEGLAAANENQLNTYGYSLLNGGEPDKAVPIFLLATERYPKSANTWDSLGEAYVKTGNKKDAIASFKKSLSLNPPPPTKANSEKYLAQLGAN